MIPDLFREYLRIGLEFRQQRGALNHRRYSILNQLQGRKADEKLAIQLNYESAIHGLFQQFGFPGAPSAPDLRLPARFEVWASRKELEHVLGRPYTRITIADRVRRAQPREQHFTLS